MKKTFTLTLILLVTFGYSLHAQKYYWVFFKDKANTEFNPYEYFDQKAIDRRIKSNISLYDISDYPLNNNYVKKVSELSDEFIGETRWFNGVAIAASDINIEYIKGFDFVKEVVSIYSEMEYASYEEDFHYDMEALLNESSTLSKQISRFQGQKFVDSGINGKGLRIAVFDGGFPGVDNHIAFKHLRDNNQIIKTWNFPKKRENVYGWNSHGTSVLSCIAGITPEGQMLGLATGAEFLLARTEIGPEPAKEEVWWLQAAEWADKNGADIINSSLGYASDRHYIHEMDGKTAIVTRAANMAASKGILVCNSAGNEGSNPKWRIIGAPADADSILSVGGISTNGYSRIGFSSIGPTADGRLKPNVCAFGIATTATKTNPNFSSASGTSFSSPLVAGFAACAWQTRRDLTAIEMKYEIEKSADLYPYFDYAFGYGVPQASYFIDNEKKNKGKTFEFEVDSFFVSIKPISNNEKIIFYHIENENGILDYYTQIELFQWEDYPVKIDKSRLSDNKTLRVFYDGYIDTYKLTEEDILQIEYAKNNNLSLPANYFGNRILLSTNVKNQKQSPYGLNGKYSFMLYFSYSKALPSSIDDYSLNYWKTNSYTIGLRYKYNIKKWYSLGVGLEFNTTKYNLKDFNHFQNLNEVMAYDLKKQKLSLNSLNLELFERFRLMATSGNKLGLYLDLGIYGNWTFSSVYKKFYSDNDIKFSKRVDDNFNDLNWGARARLGYGVISLIAQYRISDVAKNISDLPKFNLGLELTIPF